MSVAVVGLARVDRRAYFQRDRNSLETSQKIFARYVVDLAGKLWGSLSVGVCLLEWCGGESLVAQTWLGWDEDRAPQPSQYQFP